MPTANGSHERVVPLTHRSYASPIPSTRPRGTGTSAGPTAREQHPARAATTATSHAPRTPSRVPRRSACPASRPASAGGVHEVVQPPIANWSAVMDTRGARPAGSPPATSAIRATTAPSSSDGNGWTRRTRRRPGDGGRARALRSGSSTQRVDGRRARWRDAPGARGRRLVRRRRARGSSRPGTRSAAGARPATWDRIPGTSAHSATAGTISRPCGVLADRGGRAAAGSEHAFEFPFAQPSSAGSPRPPGRRRGGWPRRASSPPPRRRSGSAWSARRARYSVGSADRPVAPTGPPGRR